jgi:hypothetical protein
MTALKWITAALAGMLAFLAHAADLTGKPRVIDGDTIEIAGLRITLPFFYVCMT